MTDSSSEPRDAAFLILASFYDERDEGHWSHGMITPSAWRMAQEPVSEDSQDACGVWRVRVGREPPLSHGSVSGPRDSRECVCVSGCSQAASIAEVGVRGCVGFAGPRRPS